MQKMRCVCSMQGTTPLGEIAAVIQCKKETPGLSKFLSVTIANRNEIILIGVCDRKLVGKLFKLKFVDTIDKIVIVFYFLPSNVISTNKTTSLDVYISGPIPVYNLAPLNEPGWLDAISKISEESGCTVIVSSHL
jgi:hypothetical protein